MQHNEAPVFDRLIAAGSYLTMGAVGMIWFLLNFIVIKKPMKPYLMCNIMQSFIISIIFAIINLAYNIFIELLVSIPLIGKLFSKLNILLVAMPVFGTLSLVNYIILLFLIYLSALALFGKLPYVPYITDITKKII